MKKKNLLKMDKQIIKCWLTHKSVPKKKADMDRDIVYFDTKAMLIKKGQIKPFSFPAHYKGEK